ncbi:MAG: isochorismate synthase MenF [Solirubrobacterales bacterium]
MTLSGTITPGEFALSAADEQRLLERLEEAVSRARRHGRTVLGAVTVELDAAVDPALVGIASREGGEPWFCCEQPEREHAALATLGSVVALEASGPRRFDEVAGPWRELARDAACDAPHGPADSGPLAVGGFAFADEGGNAPHWAGFAPASLHVPEVVVSRRGEVVLLTLCAAVEPGDEPRELATLLAARAARLPSRPLPLVDPDPAVRARVTGAMPPEHYEDAVARAAERIRAGDLEKVVLAREVQVHASRPHDAPAIFGLLREAFTGCHVIAVGRGGKTFLAASPELLVRRQGLRASTLALAGSIGRSSDPATDDHLGEQLMRSEKDREEQAIVTRRIVRTLSPRSVWVTAPEEPVLARVANIQHLATPIRAQLREPVSAIELAGLLHPTPAVGGEPREAATPLITAVEGLDRGWYAGPVGWTDVNEDG